MTKTVSTTARLALGNVARSLSDESPTRATIIVERLLKELSEPTSSDSTWPLLLAVGNTGAVEALPTLIRYTDDPSAELRGAAAWAMRWIDSPQVDVLLTTKALLDDRDPRERLEAVRALRFREKTNAIVTAEETALGNEADSDVRVELLTNLWETDDPTAKNLVEKAAKDDPSPTVQEAAAKMLEKAHEGQ